MIGFGFVATPDPSTIKTSPTGSIMATRLSSFLQTTYGETPPPPTANAVAKYFPPAAADPFVEHVQLATTPPVYYNPAALTLQSPTPPAMPPLPVDHTKLFIGLGLGAAALVVLLARRG